MSTPAPLVSVITPVYNAERYLSQAIESVLAQSHRHFEYLLIDDCSPDRCREIITNYGKRDSRINGIFLEKNGGPANARNEGLKRSTGEFIAFIDADDVWEPAKLERQLARFAGNPRLGLVSVNGYVINEHGARGRALFHPREVRSGKISLQEYLLDGVPIATSATMIRQSCIATCGYFEEKYFLTDDYVMWMRVCQRYEIEILDERLIRYREHTENITRNRLRTRQEKMLVLENEILSNAQLVHELGTEFLAVVQRKYCSLGKLYSRNGDYHKAEEQYVKSLRHAVNPLVTMKTRLYQLLNRLNR